MLQRISDILWTVVGLLFQLVLAAVLIALIMGDAAGSVVIGVYGNVKELLVLHNRRPLSLLAPVPEPVRLILEISCR